MYTYKTVDIHPVRVGLSTGCALYFKRIEIRGVWVVEWEEVGYAMYMARIIIIIIIFFFNVIVFEGRSRGEEE